MVGSVNRALPQTSSRWLPTAATSTGLAGSALVISASSRPETSAAPSESACTPTVTWLETS